MTTTDDTAFVLKDRLTTWAASRTDEVVFEPTDGYYSFDILADVFEEGKKHGQNNFKTELRKKYFENSKMVSTAISDAIKYLSDQHVMPKKIFISLSFRSSKIIISIDKENLLSPEFVKGAYSKLSTIELACHEKAVDINLALIDDSAEIDIELLSSDGFGFMYDFEKGKELAS